MKLTFLYQPVSDLQTAVEFYRDGLGWDEAWRESDDTVAFWTPDRAAQVMLSYTEQPAGPMYLVDDLGGWIAEHADLEVVIARYEIPGGTVAGFAAPGGSVFYVFDQPDA
ncbi:VOC family protein [Microbacterium pumilum]|uniref:VOC domain-containing protein n=1 Tax=Microbacterium pumilum TaxID=344165 RepID=A0ABN2T0F3_9MICO